MFPEAPPPGDKIEAQASGASPGKIGAMPSSPAEDPGGALSFAKWCAMLPSWVFKSRTPFSKFLLDSTRLQRDFGVTATTMFPIPAPLESNGLSIWDKMSLGTPSNVRAKIHRARLLFIIVMALNFWHFEGFHFDMELLRGSPSSTHRRIHEKLRAMIRSEWSTETFCWVRAGRRFPQLGARLAELSSTVTDLGLSGSPYSRSFQGREVQCDNSVMPELEPYRDLDPGRIALFGKGNWDATEWLQDGLVMAYREPMTIHVDRVPEVWGYPALRDSEDVITALAKLWDKQGILRLHSIETPHFEKVRIFGAYKNEKIDRQIGDRRGRNAVESKVDGVSHMLPAGDDLLSIHLDPKKETLRLSVSDRRDFYHQFWVTRARSNTNTLYPPISTDQLAETEAYDEYVKLFAQRRYRRDLHGDLLLLDTPIIGLGCPLT